MLKRLLKRKAVTEDRLVPAYLGVVLPLQGLQLIAPEAFAKPPQCDVEARPTEAAWKLLRLVVRGPLFLDEVLACMVDTEGRRFLVGVAVVHLCDVMHYDQSLLIPIGTVLDTCEPDTVLAIASMEKLLNQFAEAQRL